MSQQKHQYPIFAPPEEGGYDVTELHRLTGLSEGYIVNVKRGTCPVSPRFRRWCVLGTGRTEEELFGPTSDPAQEEADATQH